MLCIFELICPKLISPVLNVLTLRSTAATISTLNKMKRKLVIVEVVVVEFSSSNIALEPSF